MPKTYTAIQKLKWLELYEQGKTEVWIARERAKCDTRTVKKGIEDARRVQDARVARVELVKEALRRHNDNLLEETSRIMAALQPPSRESAPLSWHRNGESIFTEPKDAKEQEAELKLTREGKDSGDDGANLRDLLREHLKHDRSWKALTLWEKAYASHLAEKTALQRRTVALIEEKTRYKIVDKDIPSPFVYSYTTGDLFFREAIRRVFATSGVDLISDIVSDSLSGTVRYRSGTILAQAPRHEEECRTNLIEALEELQASPDVVRVVHTYEELEQACVKARQAFAQVLLLGLVPGQCQICKRLGL